MQEIIKKRTKQIGIDIILLINQFPNSIATRAISNQIIRSATSIDANYRAACRAKSTADFINKLKIVEEETDETIYWLEILEESNIYQSPKIKDLKIELNEILSIVVSSIKTLRNKQNKT